MPCQDEEGTQATHTHTMPQRYLCGEVRADAQGDEGDGGEDEPSDKADERDELLNAELECLTESGSVEHFCIGDDAGGCETERFGQQRPEHLGMKLDEGIDEHLSSRTIDVALALPEALHDKEFVEERATWFANGSISAFDVELRLIVAKLSPEAGVHPRELYWSSLAAIHVLERTVLEAGDQVTPAEPYNDEDGAIGFMLEGGDIPRGLRARIPCA